MNVLANKLGLDGEGFMGMGWMRELPDFRDYTQQTPSVKEKLEKIKFAKTAPASVDLRAWCSPIENQGELGSCTANAGTGLFEYFEKKASSTYIDASRLFLYKTTRNLLGLTGDSGAYLRTTAEAMLLFGVPPEKYCPYIISKFDDEPAAFLYSFADNYKAVNYYRYDPPGTPKAQLLSSIKKNLGGDCLPCSASQFTPPSTWQQEAGRYPIPLREKR